MFRFSYRFFFLLDVKNEKVYTPRSWRSVFVFTRGNSNLARLTIVRKSHAHGYMYTRIELTASVLESAIIYLVRNHLILIYIWDIEISIPI